ncbi:MAG: 4-(cytidine 5'-diphospho)-2-C-methyl-D-erythritol kinase, partial [Candidatus Omnitrophica bacterium]|nr:4-(cytidine 5'-diphospho)-2-C-methyl-D-erythritol kinase [Candidatus Omnitrophota bacterium]
MTSITLNSYAKLNLVLNVLGKRPDGFHQLRTIFERIDLHDTITLKKRSFGIHISCNHPHVPLGPKNLVYKIALKLQNDFGIKEGVSMTIRKRIPVAAGLAGGSSNAATVLLGLNQLWNLNLSQKKLIEYA